MTHADHVRLIQNGISKNAGGIWADFGSGEGAFTLALRDVVGENAEIYSIDKDKGSLARQKEQFENLFSGTNIEYLTADFSKQLDLPLLDGLIAANSLHFHKNTVSVIKHLASYLKPNGMFIVVEYNADSGNFWVPHPFSYSRFEEIAKAAGLKNPKLLATTPSRFLNEIYTAKAQK